MNTSGRNIAAINKLALLLIVVALFCVCLAAAACSPSNNSAPSQNTNLADREDTSSNSSNQSTTPPTGGSNTPTQPEPVKPTEKELWKRFLDDADFTVIAGTWENAAGMRLVIAPDGAMGEISSNENFTGFTALAFPRMNQDSRMFAREGVYFATIGTKLTDPAEINALENDFLPGVGVTIFPTGQEIIVSDTPGNSGNPTPVKTDITKIRMILGQNTLDGWLPDNQDQIFYRVSADYKFD